MSVCVCVSVCVYVCAHMLFLIINLGVVMCYRIIIILI